MERGMEVPQVLATLADLVNTKDIEDARDALGSPVALRDWLAEHDLMGAQDELSEADLERARSFREALREAGEANAGHRPSPGDGALDRIAASIPVRLHLGATPRLESAGGHGIDFSLATMLGWIYAAMLDGTWRRFKACGNTECRWAFYDTSRNRSGQWCSMAICGNRMKGRAFRRRRRASRPA